MNGPLIKEIEQLNKRQNQNLLDIDPIKTYTKPTLIGLNNIGATCYMNATLQCFSQTEPLTRYFLKDKNKEMILRLAQNKDSQFTKYYMELIHELWNKSRYQERNPSYSPYKFRKIVEQMNPLFKEGQANDAKDFIIFVLESLHIELRKPNNNIVINYPINQYDRNSSLKSCICQLEKEGVSIISDLFYGFNETLNECQNCVRVGNNGLKYNHQMFHLLIFPLEEVRKYKLQYYNNQLNNFYNNCVLLDDCFYYNQKMDYFCGDNANFCNQCQLLCDAKNLTRIYSSPIILIIMLNRGKNNIYNVNVVFDEVIDITKFVQTKDQPQLSYSLYGVITHLGQSGPTAHFVAACKSPIDNRWYRYNDAMVKLITNFKNDVLNFGVPYILFYKKIIKSNQSK